MKGSLNFACMAILPGRSICRRLINATCSLTQGHDNFALLEAWGKFSNFGYSFLGNSTEFLFSKIDRGLQMKIFSYLRIVQVVRTLALVHTTIQNELTGLSVSLWYIAIVRRLPCELIISCTSTTAESREKIWYQLNAFKPPRWLKLLPVLRRWFCCCLRVVYCHSHYGSL